MRFDMLFHIVALNESLVTIGTLVGFISSVNFSMSVERSRFGNFLPQISQVTFFPEILEEGIEPASPVLINGIVGKY